MTAIYKVGVIGGGVMGRGIAMLIAEKGTPVVIKEVNQDLVAGVYKSITETLYSRVNRGNLSDSDAMRIKGMISITDDIHDLGDAELVIEAVPENLDLKQKVFRELDEVLQPWGIIASNTSSLSITQMASVTRRADRFAGLHFFNPVHRMRLVELVATAKTQQSVLKTLQEFAEELGKVVISVKECPGFLVNRLLMPYLNEAALMLTETFLTPEDIDSEAVQNGWPMGPFLLLDQVVGIDVAAEVAKILYAGYGERAKPAPLIEALVRLKRGFYGGDQSVAEIIKTYLPEAVQTPLSPSDGYERMILGLVNEAFMCLDEGVASATDIELGCRTGIGFPGDGPLHWAQSRGLVEILNRLTYLENKYGSRFEPNKLLRLLISQNKPVVEVSSLDI